jgi:hypothetical protein
MLVLLLVVPSIPNKMLAVRGIFTSTVRSHARRSDRVVLVEAALLNELLRHYIAG